MSRPSPWTATEIAIVAPLAAAELEKGVVLWRSVTFAQQALPAARRMVITKSTHVTRNPKLCAAIEAAKVKAPAAESPLKRRGRLRGAPTIRWTDEEEARIIPIAVAELQQGAKSLLVAVRRAQLKAEPPVRQRKLQGISNITPDLRKTIETKFCLAPTPPLASLAEAAVSLTEEPTPPPPNAVEEWLRAMMALPAQMEALNRKQAVIEDTVLRLLEGISGGGGLAAVPDLQAVADLGLPGLRKLTKLKVLLVGVKSDQFAMVDNKWGKFFELGWIHDITSNTKGRCNQKDYVISCRFVDHHQIDMIVAIVGKERHVHVTTPVGDICRVLERIYDAQVEQLPPPATPKTNGNGAVAHH